MGAAEATAAGLCQRCGANVTAADSACRHCGVPTMPQAPPHPPWPSPDTAFSTPTPATAFGTPPPATAFGTPPPPPWPSPAVIFGTQSPPPSPTPRANRRPLVLAIAAIVALLLTGGVAIVVTKLLTATAQSTVEDYFAALADGDASAALELVFLGDKIDAAQNPLLTDGALAGDSVRPAGVRIGDVRSADPTFGRQAQVVEAKYRANGTDLTMAVVVVKGDDDGYLLRAPFVNLAVMSAQGRAVKVNGVDVNTQGALAGFPGTFHAEVLANTLLTAATATAVPALTDQGTYVAALDFGTPTLVAGAKKQIESQVRTAIDTCASTTVAQTVGCPFGLNVWGRNASVKWSILTYPAIAVLPAATGWFGAADGMAIGDDGSGKVHWATTYIDATGKRRAESGDAVYRINGVARASTTGIQVSIA